jgi:hypothetical protein
MGCSASAAGSDLSARAQEHAALRNSLIEKMAEEHGIPIERAQEMVMGARRRLSLQGGNSSPNLTEHGVAAPVVIGGETYGTTEVDYRSGGDRVLTVVRPIGGGRFATRRVRQCVDGGDYTRVVAEARGS